MNSFFKSIRGSLPLAIALAGVLTLGTALDADAGWGRGGRGGGWHGQGGGHHGGGGWQGRGGGRGDHGDRGGWNGGGRSGRRGCKVPELAPATAGGALIVLVGGAFIAIDRRRKPVRALNER